MLRQGESVVEFTPVRHDDTFVDAQGVTVHYYSWKSAKPNGVVQLVHGLGEYAGRHEPLIARLVAAGYTVYADDHRGHGQTGVEQAGGDLAKLGALGPGGMRAVVRDVMQLTEIIRRENPDLPLALLGHSWGSFLAQLVLNRAPRDYDAVILTGTAYRTLRRMNGGNLNARHHHLGTTGYEWLSRDPAIAEAALADPLVFTANGLKLFGLADSLRLLGRPARRLPRGLPLLIQIGSDDTVGGPRSAELLADSYRRRSGLSDVVLIVYPDARHEIFNETNRDEVIGDTLGWLDSRLGRASA
jgi:alpha-beta hydrolase superfamily lysophospholipase